MKPKDIIIAAILILIITSLLSGCSSAEKITEETAPAEVTSPAIESLVKKAEAVQKDAKLILQADKSGNQLKVKVSIDNPSSKPVTSVQAWLSFDTSVLSGSTINTEGSAFDIRAPYEKDFDNTSGLVMLGRSNSSPVTDKQIYVGEVDFSVIGDSTIFINAYDYRDDLSGHSSANVIVDGQPYNILQKPESPALVIQK